MSDTACILPLYHATRHLLRALQPLNAATAVSSLKCDDNDNDDDDYNGDDGSSEKLSVMGASKEKRLDENMSMIML